MIIQFRGWLSGMIPLTQRSSRLYSWRERHKHQKFEDTTKRQIAVATYFMDRLSFRDGYEKDDDEIDTVGCCTLKVENVKP
ncbi:hypothetical protein Nepgr_020086 [Nepenthes gracilis]|uniref:DNA topoisomerase n=1 Tax=Nepenthes gracilis TaxID=150966 RepID=A0AAD3SUP0_NEPGR|nr:hypothetical protein Nepgr_020086 [Nepenthes gracilis]